MRILIVDDRPLGARKLRDDILSAEPEYQVELAAGEGEAADLAKQIVQDARERFDVFLIDDNMGTGLSGSELMTELRQLSPNSEAIVFTAYADEHGKRRAIEAGARAYIPRPINERELLWQLRGVQEERSTRRERDWLQLLTLTTEKLQQVTSIQEAGQAIVEGVKELGFQRARLRMVCGGQGEHQDLIGVSQMGNIGLPADFTTAKRSFGDLPYSRKVIVETRKPTLFHARELGEAPWDESIDAPKDDWFKVPLFIGNEPIGTLSLDNGADPCKYTSDDRRQLEQLLDLFGKQAAAALARVRLQEQMEREAEKQAIFEAERTTLREANLLWVIPEESLAADTDEEKVISVILRQGQEMFGHQAEVILMQRWWITDESQETVHEVCRYHHWNHITEECHPSDTISMIMREAFEKGETVLRDSSLAVPIKTTYKTMGCLYVSCQDVSTARVERLAVAAAVALDNVQRQVRLRAALEALKQVTGPTGLQQAFKAVVTAARKASHNLECMTLWYRDPVSKKHRLGEQWGVFPSHSDPMNLEGIVDYEQHALIDYIMTQRESLWLEDIHDARTNTLLRSSSFVKRQKIVSSVIFPLWAENESVGALFFSYRRPRRFSPGERNELSIFAATVAASIYNVQLLEQAKQGQHRLSVALKVVNAVGTELNLDAVLSQVLTALKEHFYKSYVDVQPYVLLYDEPDTSLYLPAAARTFAPVGVPAHRNETRLVLDDSDRNTVCRVARESRAIGDIFVENIADVRYDSEFLLSNSKTQSMLCAGLASKERLWGVLAVSSPEDAAFNEQDRYLMELVARQALIAMERAEQAAKLRFKDAVSSVTTWAAELAHDINREIGFIRNRAYWLREEPNLSEQGRGWAQEIDAGAQRLVDVTRSVRTDQQMDIQEFDLYEMLSRRIVDLVSQRWPRITVIAEFDTPEVWLYSYSERLWRAVRHLVRNAAEAMGGDGVIIVRINERVDKVEIQIEDTGPGVPVEAQKSLLEQPFTNKGTLQDGGYGLLIARQLIESLGGQIRLLPQAPARGAIFSITLPLTPERLS